MAESKTPRKPKQLGERLRENISRVIVGKPEVIDLLLTSFLANGHVLIQDVPGLGKTLLARALARSIAARFSRVQFTPDLLPSDITGTSIYNEQTREFEFREGPVFANVLLGDELNRATPRTQSALLEAMEERQVTVDGITHDLPPLFFVVATQNPVEQQGVYDLPEAQLDRFLMQLTVGYPDRRHEVLLVKNQLVQRPIDKLEVVAQIDDIVGAQTLARAVHVDDSIVNYAVRLAERTREHSDLILGASPRASLALVTAAQAYTWLTGGDYVLPDTIKTLAHPVLRHRLIIKPQSILAGKTGDWIIDEVLNSVEVPVLV